MMRLAKIFTLLLSVAVLMAGTTACKKKPKDPMSAGRPSMTNGMRTVGVNGGAPDATSLNDSGMNNPNGLSGSPNSNGLGNPESASNGVEGQPIAELPNVYFGLDSDELDSAATTIIDNGSAYLKKNTALNVVLRGHCDDTGTSEYNYALGSRRAQRVRDALIERGIDANRLQTMSFGKDMPAAQGTDEASRAQNRRVEFFVFTQ